jgi:hypothetical protein
MGFLIFIVQQLFKGLVRQQVEEELQESQAAVDIEVERISKYQDAQLDKILELCKRLEDLRRKVIKFISRNTQSEQLHEVRSEYLAEEANFNHFLLRNRVFFPDEVFEAARETKSKMQEKVGRWEGIAFQSGMHASHPSSSSEQQKLLMDLSTGDVDELIQKVRDEVEAFLKSEQLPDQVQGFLSRT